MTERRGAYGLALPDLAGQQWLTPAPDDWPTWSFVERREPLAPPAEPSPALAVVRGEGERSEYIDREAATTTLTGGDPLPAHALVHPVLGTTAAVHAHWQSRLTFHAGSFVSPAGGAWGVLGDREQGKSSALAWIAANGLAVLADDLMITDGEFVLAGPRCIDLRETSARALEVGREVGGQGLRRRWRVDLPSIAPAAPLRGWVVLRWSDHVRAIEVPAEERGRWLGGAIGLHFSEQPPLPWLGALAKPMVEFSRPPSWAGMDGAMWTLLDRVDATYR